MKRLLALGIFIFLVNSVHGQTGKKQIFSLTQLQGAFGAGWQYDRGFAHSSEMLVKGGARINRNLQVAGGYLYTKTTDYAEHTVFADANLSFALLPFEYAKYFSAELLYIYFNNFEYEWKVSSVIPLLGFKSKYFSASIGPHYRWTTFFGMDEILEGMWAIDLKVIPLNLTRFSAGINIANFDEFYQGSFWDFYLQVFFNYNIKEHVTLENYVTLMQSGLDGFTVTFYGIKLRSVIRITW